MSNKLDSKGQPVVAAVVTEPVYTKRFIERNAQSPLFSYTLIMYQHTTTAEVSLNLRWLTNVAPVKENLQDTVEMELADLLKEAARVASFQDITVTSRKGWSWKLTFSVPAAQTIDLVNGLNTLNDALIRIRNCYKE